MLFSSMTFLYVFLPIVLLLCLIAKKELHNSILLIASIIFYAWGEPKYLAIMFLTILITYFGALGIEKYPRWKKVLLLCTLLGELGFLFYFKYFNFLITNINALFHSQHSLLDIVMPIGISFYTFQSLSYVIDVYRGECTAQKDISKLTLYVCLFPQLIAGPIVKYHDISGQIEDRVLSFEKVSLGAKRFIVGLAKKVLIANTMGAIVDKIFVQDPSTFPCSVAWLGSVAYTLQLYFDFSGYSDMAIGLGLIFGFNFKENFNHPYISKSIT
ncbi:MAG TPA: transcriptional regulator, partial [Porphyromonadaceae bacterium]|nr:transcriptional regulator [Porphyromonadaceae bacterium]